MKKALQFTDLHKVYTDFKAEYKDAVIMVEYNNILFFFSTDGELMKTLYPSQDITKADGLTFAMLHKSKLNDVAIKLTENGHPLMLAKAEMEHCC